MQGGEGGVAVATATDDNAADENHSYYFAGDFTRIRLP